MFDTTNKDKMYEMKDNVIWTTEMPTGILMPLKPHKFLGFEEVPQDKLKHPNVQTQLPTRADSGSAGYDFYSKETVTIEPRDSHLFWSDVCSYMNVMNTHLELHVRSSIGVKKGLMLKNVTGIIDASYYPNNIGISLYNNSDVPVTIESGERIAQGIFKHHLLADDDIPLYSERTGGFGSSNR